MNKLNREEALRRWKAAIATKRGMVEKMKLKALSIAILLMAFLNGYSQSQREVTSLNEGWKFSLGDASSPSKDFGCGTEYFNYLTKANSIHNEGPYSMKFDDAKWQDIMIPHDWVATLPFSEEASHSHGYKTVGHKFPTTSVGWYRKIMHIGKEDEGKHIMLQFDGIFRDAQVWFNGYYLGREPSGYATQVYDVSEYVNYGGDNLICVRADATLEEGWFYEGAGIYRDAWLVKSDAVAVAPFGTFVYTSLHQPYQRAVVHVETEVNNYLLTSTNCEVEQRLLDSEGKEVGRAENACLDLKAKQTAACKQEITLSQPKLWSPASPYLYKVETTVKVDGKVTDVYTTNTGIREVGFEADRGFILNGKPLKLKGVNVHQDHAGVGSAIPDALLAWRIQQLKKLGCNAYRSSHNPTTPALLDICDREGILVIDENRLAGINKEHIRLLENMIKRDRNHPSIILWSDANEEWGMENNIQGTRIAESMREYTRLLDSTRHSTIANAGGSEMIKGLDVVGYNYIVQNDVDNRRKQHPKWKIVGTEETTGCGTRGVYFSSDEHPGRMPSKNLGMKPGVENVIERGWKFYAEHPWAAGVFYWTGFDYRGEPNPLKFPAHESEFGILDYCGNPKDEAWYLKAWWTDEPTLHVFPHWNLEGHEGEEIELWAYSNCDEVELLVNGKKLERQTMPKNGHLKWKAIYQPGKVVAYGYRKGKRVLTQVLETTQPAYQLVLKSNRPVISADGKDVAVVSVEVQDRKGRVVPNACQMLHLTLEGDAHILGVGNGDPEYLGADHPKEMNCKSFQVPAFNGLAQVLIQSNHTASPVVLYCKSEKLKMGVLNLVVK